MAMELKIPVIALQLSEAVELRETKTYYEWFKRIEFYWARCIIVAFLYREDYYNRDPKEKTNTSVTELIV